MYCLYRQFQRPCADVYSMVHTFGKDVLCSQQKVFFYISSVLCDLVSSILVSVINHIKTSVLNANEYFQHVATGI